MSASVGTGRSSIAAISETTVVSSSAAPASSSPMKIETSAPAEKSSPSARTSRARMSLSAAWSTAARRSASRSALKRFSGGLSITISPSRSFCWKVASGISVAGVGGVVLRVLGFEPVAARGGADGEERLEGDLRVVALDDLGPHHVLDLECSLEVGVGPEVESPLRVRHRHRREGRDLLGELQRTRGRVVD